jgi:hypothetical protein
MAHGGKRTGAGRKARVAGTETAATAVRLTPSEKAIAVRKASKRSITVSEFVRQLIRQA